MKKTSPQGSEPIKIEINDSARVRAALNLSEAIKDLAKVISGNSIMANISHCHFTSTTESAGLSIGAKLDQ